MSGLQATTSNEIDLTPLQKAQKKMAEMRADPNYVPPERLDPVQKAKKNPNSPKLAIKAHCWTCCGAGADPGVKQSVRDCVVLTCALHPHRPWQKVSGKSADQMTEDEFAAAASGDIVDTDLDDDSDEAGE